MWFQTHYLSYSLTHYLAASQALCWSKEGRRENDENADSDDDNDGCCDIPKVFWYKLIKKLPLSSTIQGNLSSCKDSCNHPFRMPAPSVFPLPCITINLGSFILIVSYLLNWQSQRRTIETKLILKISQSAFSCSCTLLKELSRFFINLKESLNTVIAWVLKREVFREIKTKQFKGGNN